MRLRLELLEHWHLLTKAYSSFSVPLFRQAGRQAGRQITKASLATTSSPPFASRAAVVYVLWLLITAARQQRALSSLTKREIKQKLAINGRRPRESLVAVRSLLWHHQQSCCVVSPKIRGGELGKMKTITSVGMRRKLELHTIQAPRICILGSE